MNNQLELMEALGLGKITDMNWSERRIVEGWLIAFEDNMDDLLEKIETFQRWYYKEAGSFPTSVHLYKKAIMKLEADMLLDGRILIKQLSDKWRA